MRNQRSKPGIRYCYYGALFSVAVIVLAATKDINSSVYNWDNLKIVKSRTGSVRDILKGPTRSLEMFNIKALTLRPGKATHMSLIEKGCDELFIIKEGSAEISVNNVKKILNAGSIAVASQGDRVQITSSKSGNLTYYEFVFRPWSGTSPGDASKKVIPYFAEWDTIKFIPSANGGRRNIIQQTTSSMEQLEIHVTTLKEGLPSHAAHTHPDEEIILVRYGYVEQTINGKPYRLGPGSVIFLSNDDNHGIGNAGKEKCEYYAIRWITNSGRPEKI